MAISITSGDLTKGGGVFESSGGVKVAVFVNGSGDLVIYSDVDSSPSLEDSETPTTMFGGGVIGHISVAMDSNDNLRIIAACTTEQTRDVAYCQASHSAGSWTLAASWYNAYTYTEQAPVQAGVAISVDSSDELDALVVDAVKVAGSTQDNVYHTHFNGSSWGTATQIGLRSTKTDVYRFPKITHRNSDYIEAYYSGILSASPWRIGAYRTYTTSWSGESYSGTYSSNAIHPGGILASTSGTVSRVCTVYISTGIIYENGTTVGYYYEYDQGIGASFVYPTTLDNLSTKYILYIENTDNDVGLLSNSGSGWTDEGALEETTAVQVISNWAYNNLNNTTSIDYIFENSVGAIYYNEYTPSGDSHALTAVGITTTPTLGTPTIGQKHILSSVGITTTPIVGTPTVSEMVNLTAVGITADPTLGTPTISVIHNLTANNIAASPVVGTPSIGQTHVLGSVGITANPVLGVPNIGQEHDLISVGVSTTPALGVPIIGQTHPLVSIGITSSPILDVPSIGQIHGLDAISITSNPVLGIPSIGQTHALNAVDITSTPVLGVPTLSVETTDDLEAVGITSNPVLDVPSIGQTHVLDSIDITSNPVLGIPTIGQTHALDSVGITSTPVLGTPALSTQGTDALEAVGITTNPTLGVPSLGQTHALTAVGITANPLCEIPTIGPWPMTPAIEDLVEYYRLNETSGVAGGAHNSLDLANPGEIGSGDGKVYLKSRQFNAEDSDYFDSIIDYSELCVTGDFTIGFWAYIDSLDSVNDRTVLEVLDDYGGGYVIKFTTDGKLAFGIKSNGVVTYCYSPSGPAGPVIGRWEYWVCWWDLSTNTAYIRKNNGSKVKLGSMDAPNSYSSNFHVGGGPIGVNDYFDGRLQSLEFHDALLTDFQHSWLWNDGSGRNYNDHVPVALDAVNITTTPVLGIPTLSQIHVLDAADITTTPTLGVPTILESHDLISVGITTAAVLGTPDIEEINDLDSVGITATSTLGTPTLGIFGEVNLDAVGITVTPTLDIPDLLGPLPPIVVPDPYPKIDTIVYVLDTSLKVIGMIEDYYSLIWTERYSEAGDFELEVPISYAFNSIIAFGNFLYIKESDKLMVIEDLKPSTSETQTSLLVNGESAEGLLKRRVLLDPINVNGLAEEIIYTFISTNVTNPTDSNRKIDIFKTTFPTPSISKTFEEQLDRQTVYDTIKNICKQTGLGFKVVKENNELAFSVCEGKNRSYDQSTNPFVIFSDGFENVIASSFYESEKNKVNTVLVTSEDRVLELRKVFVWEDGGDEPTGLERSETVLEANIQRIIGVEEAPETPEEVPEPPEPLELPNYPEDPVLGISGKVPLQAIGITVTPVFEAAYPTIHHLTAIGITANPTMEMPWTPPPLTDAEMLAIMHTRGRQVIEENKSVGLFEGDFDIQGNFKYGIDFFMGDIVQCSLEGRNVKARVIELVRSYSTEGEKSYVAMDFVI